jgi:secondary thiamine-phosphate synthase enzyme
MRIHTANHTFETKEQYQTVDLTQFLEGEVTASGVSKGLAVIYTGHTTGAIVLNEFDPWLREDLKDLLMRLVPNEGDYRHPNNGNSHLASIILSHSQCIPILDGEAALGTWQSIFWVEAERRPRTRTVELMIIGE